MDFKNNTEKQDYINTLIKNLDELEVSLGSKDEIIKGVVLLAEMVKVTLGAKGRNVMYVDAMGYPKITKDGVTVTRNVFSKNKYQQMAIDVVREAAEKTVRSSGDGTTTTIILAEALILRGIEAMQKGMSYYELSREIDKIVDIVVDKVKENSIDVRSSNDLEKVKNVATVSSNSEEIGTLIYDIISRIGFYGNIEVKKSKKSKTTFEVVEGIKLHKGFMAPQFVNDKDNMKWHVKDGVYIVLYNGTIRSFKDIYPYVNEVNGERDEEGNLVLDDEGNPKPIHNRPILFIADDVEKTILTSIIQNKLANPNINWMFVEHDGMGERKQELMTIVETLTSAQAGDVEVIGSVGYAEEVIVDSEFTSILNGLKVEDEVENMVASCKDRLQQEDISKSDLIFYRKTLAALTGGIAVIHVGGTTDVEMVETKDRIDDAVEAVRSAIEHGVCLGGGYTALKINSEIRKEVKSPITNMMSEVLIEPFKQLCKNADIDNYKGLRLQILSSSGHKGYDLKDNTLYPIENYKIYDSAGVLIDSLKNAASVAKSILSTSRTLNHN